MTVLFHGSVKEKASGCGSLEIKDAGTVRELIGVLGERFGEAFRDFLLGDDTCFFLVNGSGIMTTGGLNMPLSDSDTFEVLPYVGGG